MLDLKIILNPLIIDILSEPNYKLETRKVNQYKTQPWFKRQIWVVETQTWPDHQVKQLAARKQSPNQKLYNILNSQTHQIKKYQELKWFEPELSSTVESSSKLSACNSF